MRVFGSEASIRDDQAIAIPFDLFGNGFILDDLILYTFMPADGIVDRALDQDELPVGDGISAFGIIDFARRETDRESCHHQRHDNFFPERAQDLEGHDGEHVRFCFDGLGIAGGKSSGGEEGVGVDEAQPLAARCGCSLVQGMGFTCPAWREVGAVDDVESRGSLLAFRQRAAGLHNQLTKDFRCSIGGAIIQNDDFKVGIILCEHGFHTGPNIPLFIAGGDANRDQRRIQWRRDGSTTISR